MAYHPCTGLAGSRVKAGKERESLLQVPDKMRTLVTGDGWQPYGKDWHCPLKGSQKTNDGPSLSSAARAMLAPGQYPDVRNGLRPYLRSTGKI